MPASAPVIARATCIRPSVIARSEATWGLPFRVQSVSLWHALPHADSRAGLSSAQAPDRLASPYTGKPAPSAVPPLKSKARALLLLRKKTGPPMARLRKKRAAFLCLRQRKAAILESRISKLDSRKRGYNPSSHARLAAFAIPGQGLNASARQWRGCGKTGPPSSASGSGGPLFSNLSKTLLEKPQKMVQ